MIPIFTVVLISDKNENAIINGKHVALFHLSKYFDKLYGNIVYKTQIEMNNFSQVSVSLVFAAILEFWFSGFSRLTIYKLITAITAFLIAFSIKINNKKLDQVTFEPLMNFKQSHYGSWKYSKAASFQKFSSLKLKRRTITFFVTVLFNISLKKNINQWFLGVTHKYKLRVSFKQIFHVRSYFVLEHFWTSLEGIRDNW